MSPSEQCPLSERRLPMELYTKLFVVHATVFTAYFHLKYLRRARVTIFEASLVLYSPYAMGMYLLSPLLAVLCQACINYRRPQKIREAIGFLLGRFTNNDDDSVDTENTITWPPNWSLAIGRDNGLRILLVAQCGLSVLLFYRRLLHGSAVHYDYRILQLAILGICVSFMSALHVLFKPKFPTSTSMSDSKSMLVCMYLFRPRGLQAFRDCLSESKDTKSTYSFLPMAVAWLHATFWLQFAFQPGQFQYEKGLLLEVPRILVDNVQFVYQLRYLWLASFFYFCFVLRAHYFTVGAQVLFATVAKLMVILMVFALILGILTDSNNFLGAPFRSGFGLFYMAGNPVNATGYVKVVSALNKTVFFGPNDTYFDLPLDKVEMDNREQTQWMILSDWSQIWTYQHATPLLPCPPAWRDPVADPFWWLA